MTVVFSDISSATPRTMKEVPSVTMKAGTFSLAMMVPLMRPTTAAPAIAASNPQGTATKTGSPALNVPRMASAESTDARLITQPTERSMPAEMMTKVWPRPSRTTGRDRHQDVLRIAHADEGRRAEHRHRDDEEKDHQAEEDPSP